MIPHFTVLKKEIYNRKPKEPFARQKHYANGEPVFKDVEPAEQPVPTHSVIRKETRMAKAGRYLRLVLALLAIGVVALTVYAVIFHPLNR